MNPDRRFVVAAAGGVATAWSLPLALGQPANPPATRFPERPLTLVVPFAPGGIADLTARAVVDALGPLLGQAVVVDNRPSAGSIVASQAVATARPDGHTLLLMSNGHAVSVGLFRKLPYDPVKDFAPVSLLGTFDLGLFVAAGSRFKSLKDLLAHARAQPGRLNVGTIAIGSTQHLAAKLFETQAGVDTLVVPYKGSPAVVQALRSGDVDVAFEIVGPMLPHLGARPGGAGAVVRALAVTGAQRHPTLPEVPTVREAGVAGYQVASWNALAAPAGTPPAVVEALNRAVRTALAQPATRERLARLGVVAEASSPAELQALLSQDIRRWGEVIRSARIEPE